MNEDYHYDGVGDIAFDWKTGEMSGPGLPTIKEMAEKLGCTEDELVKLVEKRMIK